MTVPRSHLSTPRRANDPWRDGEPRLTEVMADPLIQLVMRRDGLNPSLLWPLMLEIGQRLR